MKNLWIRSARAEDDEAIGALNKAAFGGPDEAEIITRLAADGDSLYSLVAHNDREILGHIQFFRISVDGSDVAAGLGPMAVLPQYQKSGIGSGLVKLGLTLMQGSGRGLIFVLGHRQYYPRFGFSPEAALAFAARWSGPAFMAQRFGDDGVQSGKLTYPAAFGA